MKSHAPADIRQRLADCAAVAQHPKIRISDLDMRAGAEAGSRSWRTLARARQHSPRVEFVWLMGADSLQHFHHWEKWHKIFMHTPLWVAARPKENLLAAASVMAHCYRAKQRSLAQFKRLEPRTWHFSLTPMLDISSTQLREE